MNAVLEYFSQNWSLILILLAFVIMLKITVFLNRTTIIRMYLLIVAVFLLSIVVFIEFYLAGLKEYPEVRLVLMAVRYSATPIIIALISYTLVKKTHWYVLLPSFVLTIINIVSIFTGVVFSLNESGELVRGVLGYLPYIGVGAYSVLLIGLLIWQSNKQANELIPIIFLAFALSSGLLFPFLMGSAYSRIFCTTIAIALFVYYVFLILQLTKKDALTGLLNRQAYYATTRVNYRDITAFISIDMNGLKAINDNGGHLAGDEALTTLANAFNNATTIKQLAYRMGGDEFIIVCRKTSEEELLRLVDRIKDNVAKTKYTCSIGYSYAPSGSKELTQMVKESDEMMYADKAKHYAKSGIDRRNN